MKKSNSLSLSKQNKLTELKQDKLSRLRNTKYQRDPIAWYKDKFGGNPKDIDWDLFDFYGKHKWDGTPNPFKLMFDSLAKWQSVAVESATSTGKCLAPGTLVRMFDGSLKPIEEVIVGDKVMGIDSTKRTVTYTHNGVDNMFLVNQEGGLGYVCNSEHLVSLKRRKRSSPRTTYLGDYVDLPIKDLLTRPKQFFKDFAGYRVPVEYKENKNCTIDHYYLGLWLGDGSSHNTGITTDDFEIVEYLTEFAKSIGLSINDVSSEDRCSTYLLSNKKGSQNHLLNSLRYLNVIKNKHIPKSYLITSRESRLKLLAGLIDSDGSRDSYGYDFISKSEVLANDVVELATSLGYRAEVVPVTKTIKKIGFKGLYYRTFISGNLSDVPVLLPRKKITEYIPHTKGGWTKRQNIDTCTIKSIDFVGEGEYYGFSLDGDHKFLLKDGTVVHNTFLLPRVIYWFLDVFPDSLVVTTAPKQSQLKQILWSEMSAAFKKFKRIRPKAEMFSLRMLPNGSAVRFGSKFSKSFNLDDLEDDDYSDQHQVIGVVSGVRADEESATKMQGFHRKYMLFVIEECAGVPHPVLTAIKNTCTGDYNIIVAVGNPDSQSDALHQFAELDHVQHIQVSAFDHPNIVAGKTLIHGAVTKKSIDIRRKEYGTKSNLFRSRVRGIAPKQASDSLIHHDWIVECIETRKEYVGIKEDPQSENALGVDVANSTNGDMACLVWGKGNIMWWIHEFQCPNANHLAHNLTKDSDQLAIENIRNYSTGTIIDHKVAGHRVGIDAVGVGVGCVNEFVDTLGYEVKSLQGGPDKESIPVDEQDKLLYEFSSLRAQMYYQARLDLQNHEIIIQLTDKRMEKALIKELTSVGYKVSDKMIVIERKEDIKKKLGGKSPNVADGFVYWNWMRKSRKRIFDDALPLGVPISPR